MLDESFVHFRGQKWNTHFITEGYIFRVFQEEVGLTFESIFDWFVAHYIFLRTTHTAHIS